MSSKARRAPRSWIWLQGAAAGGLAAVAPGPAMMIGVLLCPVVAYALFETTPGRPVTRTMAVCGSAAVFAPLRQLWDHGSSIDEALGILADIGQPLLAWTACAGGWLIHEAAHILTRLALQMASDRRATDLREEATALVAEWNLTPLEPETAEP